jgi:hypothetical protein
MGHTNMSVYDVKIIGTQNGSLFVCVTLNLTRLGELIHVRSD